MPVLGPGRVSHLTLCQAGPNTFDKLDPRDLPGAGGENSDQTVDLWTNLLINF